MNKPRKMPIGIQSFEDIRRRDFVYVDKSMYVYRVADEGKPYFLSRPRRFGKSLFLSTLEAYFLGKKDLFTGLALEKLEEEGAVKQNRAAWEVYPVLHLDLNAKKFDEKDSLTKVIIDQLLIWEEKYNIKPNFPDVELRFKTVLRTAHEKTGKQVVILVDEYDKPLLDTLDNPTLCEDNRLTMRAFFACIKSEDAHIRLAFLTGVTKFAQVSIFSELNNLKDISIHNAYSAICGISESELIENFAPEIESLAEANDYTKEECLAELKRTYDGYHFAIKCEDMYNPFSLLNTFDLQDFRYYWFATGTPSFLVKGIEKSHFDIRQMVDGVIASAEDFSLYRYEEASVIPLLYQSGYLTIKDYDTEFKSYTLKFPNEEVRNGFCNFLLPIATKIDNSQTSFYIERFVKDIREGNVDAFMQRMQSILSAVPYSLSGKKQEVTEQTFQTGIFLVFTLMGQFTQCEVHSALGRCDTVVWTRDAIYVFEYKLDGTVEEALAQIDTKEYAIPYLADATDGRKVVKIGVAFEKDKPIIKEWLVK